MFWTPIIKSYYFFLFITYITYNFYISICSIINYNYILLLFWWKWQSFRERNRSFRWWVGPWQMCPVTCGEAALRKRSVMCVFSDTDTSRSDLALPDRDCDRDIRPEEVEPCPNLQPCSTTETPLIVYADNKDTSFYNISLNEQDSITTALGLTTVEPEILEFDNVVDENPDNSMYSTKPKWTVSKWSTCSNGKRSRKVTCSIPGECKPNRNKPSSVENCRSGKWITGNNKWFLVYMHVYYNTLDIDSFFWT